MLVGMNFGLVFYFDIISIKSFNQNYCVVQWLFKGDVISMSNNFIIYFVINLVVVIILIVIDISIIISFMIIKRIVIIGVR